MNVVNAPQSLLHPPVSGDWNTIFTIQRCLVCPLGFSKDKGNLTDGIDQQI